jgi:hypothetical protein
MAGLKWIPLHKAFVIYCDNRRFFNKTLRSLLERILCSGRSLDSVRSMLAQLRKDSVLYNATQRRWTAQAIRIASSTGYGMM